MKQIGLKQTIVASFLVIAVTASAAANNGYWVVGNLVTNSCDIVSQSPMISPLGPVWFGNGPHRSYDDAKLARRAISACPRTDQTASR